MIRSYWSFIVSFILRNTLKLIILFKKNLVMHTYDFVKRKSTQYKQAVRKAKQNRKMVRFQTLCEVLYLISIGSRFCLTVDLIRIK